MDGASAAATWVFIALAAVAPSALATDPATIRAAEAGLGPEFCPALRAIVAAAPDGFSSIRGKARERGEHIWDGTKQLPRSIDCTVYGGTPPSYACILYAGDVEENADAIYASAAAGLADCLPAFGKPTEAADGTHARTTVAGGPAGPRVRVVQRDASADAYLVELWVDAKTP